MPVPPLRIYATAAYTALARAISEAGAFEEGVVERNRFPDGEHYLRIADEPRDRRVALVGGTPGPEETLELYDLACALASAEVRALTMVVPYFGYSTMERAVRPGEVVTAKHRARLLSSVPSSASGNRLLLLDLHSEGLPHYFEGGIRPEHVYAKPVVQAAARRLGGPDFVLACTDAGRAKWVESLANDLDVQASFVFKRRLDGERTEIAAVSAQVAGRRVVIYDDMIRTGGSLMQAARAYLDAGALSVAAVATHGVLPGDALERLHGSGLLTDVVCTDSHPRALELRERGLQVESVAPLLAERLGAWQQAGAQG